MSEIQISDKVVCVNDSREGVFAVSCEHLRFPGGSVVKGAVYCVERVYPGENGTQGLILTAPKIYLREGGREIGFNSTRFRKVHPRETVVAEELEEVLSASEAPEKMEVFSAVLRHQRDS